jgi:hypothetical protein
MTDQTSRRACLGTAAALLVATQARADSAAGQLALSPRSHFKARPNYREAFVICFSQVLGLGPPAVLRTSAPLGPIIAYRFPGGGSVSVEFTPDALAPDDLRRGAWLEILADDPAPLQAAVQAAGHPVIHYAATKSFYFEAPGGQVFSIVKRPGPS